MTRELTNESNVLIVGAGQDLWLQEARAEVNGEEEGDTEAGVIGTLEKMLTANRHSDAVELISHSEDQNLLTLGKWTLTIDAFKDVSAKFRELFQGKVVRLVGCDTARGKNAQETLRALEAALGVHVYGALVIIGSRHLCPKGTSRSIRQQFDRGSQFDKLVEAPARREIVEDELRSVSAPFPRPTNFELANKDALDLDPASRDLLANVLALMPDHYYDFPGLLRIPTVTRELLRPSSSIAGRVDVLFTDQLVRITAPSLLSGPKDKVFLVHPRDRLNLRRILGLPQV